MLYIVMIAAERELDAGTASLAPLATRTSRTLPAEQRVRLLSALAASLLRADTQASFGVLNQLVAA